jgi:hypothetical protein
MSGPKTNEDLKKFKLKFEVQNKFQTLKSEYKSVVELIKLQIGSLEEIRQQLSLSRRQICKLLLVDPSAWTRWTRVDDDAPPHIYQALSWYMQLKQQFPEIHAPLHLENKFDLLRKDADLKLQKMQLQMQALQAQKTTFNDPYLKFSTLLNENFNKLSAALLAQPVNPQAIDLSGLKDLLKALQPKAKGKVGKKSQVKPKRLKSRFKKKLKTKVNRKTKGKTKAKTKTIKKSRHKR